MRIATQILFGFLLLLLAHQPSAARSGGAPSRVISLNGDWQFALAHNPAEAEGMAHFYEPSAWFKKCYFQVTPEIDRALMVKGFLVSGVTLI